MQLEETLLNATAQHRTTTLMQAPASKLAKLKFHQMLIEDGMSTAIKNPEMWIRDVATKLNYCFNLQK